MQQEEGTDEVKVFRRQVVDDAEEAAPESNERLDADKKDAAIETELEQRGGNPAELCTKSGAFKPAIPSPTYPFPSFLGGGFPFSAPLSPAYLFNSQLLPGLLGFNGVSPAALLQHRTFPQATMGPFGQMSPTYNQALLAMQHAFGLASPSSPLSAFHKQNPTNNQVPLTSSLRPGALNSMTNVRVPPFNASSTSNQSQPATPKRSREEKKKSHIKKPLNAFMWYMKENRPKLMAELGFKEKQSAELNKELGKRWHELSKEAQEKYFELAKKDKEEHLKKFPNWSARDNYAIHKKKKRKREKTDDQNEAKKCRARFGTNRTDLWCQYCRRKKKCQYTVGLGNGEVSRSSSSTEPSLPGDGSHLLNGENDDIKPPFLIKPEMGDLNYESEESSDEEMEEDLDMDDPTLTPHELERVNTDQI